MSAPTGNANATRWTREATIEILYRIRKYAEMDHVLTLSRALVRVHIYKGVWGYWKRRWADDEGIMDRMYYVEEIFAMKIEEGALTKRLHAGVCLFMLRVNYGYCERHVPHRERKEMEDEMPRHLVRAYDISKAQDAAEAARERQAAQDAGEAVRKAARAERKAAKKKTVQIRKPDDETHEGPKAVMVIHRQEPAADVPAEPCGDPKGENIRIEFLPACGVNDESAHTHR